MCIITWIKENKDFFLAIAALSAPFAAVFVGLRVARKQSEALIASTNLQVRSAALRDARQRSLEKLRDEFAAQIHAIVEVNDSLKDTPTNGDSLWSKLAAIEARRVRIRLTVSSRSKQEYDDWSEAEDKVWTQLLAKKEDENFTKPQDDTLATEILALASFAIKTLAAEEKRALDFELP